MKTILTATAVLAIAALAGCVGGVEANSHLYVKDALTDDVAEVHVTFTSAQLKPVDGAWQTVFDGKQTIDLLALSSADAKEALADMSLAPGQYEGLRFAVSEVEVIDHDGNSRLLNVFGNLVQVADDFTVGAEGIDILVDFDLESGVDLEAGTYTPVVKDVQTSDDDSDGDGQNDVDDIDDDNDGETDDVDDDDDGDGEDDQPRQFYAADRAGLCANERDEEIVEAGEERNESIEEAAAERQEAYDEAEERREANLLNGNATTAQAQYEEDIAEADEEYEAAVAEADAEYAEEVEEADEEHAECLSDDDDHDEDRDDDQDDEHESEDEDDQDGRD